MRKNFPVEKGLDIFAENGNLRLSILQGTLAPDGISNGQNNAPIGSLYLRSGTLQFYRKQSNNLNPNDWKLLSADDIRAFDPNNNITTVAAELVRIGTGGGSGVTMSPIFGSNGNVPSGSYLNNAQVSSSLVGIPIGMTSPLIKSVYFNNENIVTGTIEIQQRLIGTATWNTIYTLNINNSKSASGTGLNVALGFPNYAIAAKTNVSVKSAKVTVNINGDSV